MNKNALKLGPELEFTILNSNGDVVNRASDILKETNNPYIFPEFIETWIEVGSKPSSSIKEIETELKSTLEELVEAAAKHDAIIVPLTTLRTETQPKILDKNYYHAQERIFGKENFEFAKHANGANVHVDLEDTEKGILKQYTLATALDPSFAFMSSSPFYKGNNTIKDMHVCKYRHEVPKKFPSMGELVPYQKSFEELRNYFSKNLKWFNSELEKVPFDVGPTKLANEFSAYWGNPRITYTDQKKTIEMRSLDVNTLENFSAYMALLKGVFNFTRDNQIELKIEESPEYFVLDKKGNKSSLIIPPFKKLQELEVEGYTYGFGSDNILRYDSNILNIAEKGLSKDEIHYLAPFKEMLKRKQNYASELVQIAKDNNYMQDHKLTNSGARQLRLSTYDRFINGLEGNLENVS